MPRSEAASGSPHSGGGSVRDLPAQRDRSRSQIQWLPSFLCECRTQLLHLVMKQLVRAALKGDGTVWGEDDSSNVV
jgi:hypothetical protein